MGAIEFLLTVVFAACLAAGFGVTAIASDPGEFLFAQLSFGAAGLSLASAYTIWLYKDEGAAWRQVVFGIVLVGVVGFGTPQALEWVTAHENGQHPEVAVRLVYPDIPALMLINQSDVVAREIKWGIILWNLDDPRPYAGNPNPAPDAHDPLPIPIQTFDFIPPHSLGGPQALFGQLEARELVKKGNILVGSMFANCPTCARGHTAIVYIEYGKGGWYYDIPNMQSAGVLTPERLTTIEVQSYFKAVLSSVPEEARIPIGSN